MYQARAYSLSVLLICLCVGVGSAESPDPAGALPFTEPGEDSLTFWGHACCYIDVGGMGIVTDPVFDDSYGLLIRRRVPPPPPSALVNTGVVLISHAHRDHLSAETLAQFPRSTIILCPDRAAEHLSELEQRVIVMEPGDRYELPDGVITAVQALHPGGRNGWKSRLDDGALGYIIHTPRVTLYYTGDTSYFDGLREIDTLYQPDVAVVNVNAHLNGNQALRAIDAIGAAVVVPIHHGAYYSINDLRSGRWLAHLDEQLGSRVKALQVGERLSLEPAAAAESSIDAR